MSQGSTSDYSSLSPDLTSQSSSSRDDNLNITSTTESASQRSSSPEKESLSHRSSSPTDNIEVEEVDLKKEDDESSEKLNKHGNNDDVCSENTCDTDNDASVKTRENTCQADSWTRDARDKFKSNPRRHSWAGGRLTSVGIPKQTSLQDFKKLLAQKTPSQSTNKTSAVQLLTKIESTSTEPFHSSQVRDDNGIGDTFEVNTILTD